MNVFIATDHEVLVTAGAVIGTVMIIAFICWLFIGGKD